MHTKGPWTFNLDDMEVRGQYGRVAPIQPRMEAIHNGRLIAAAPDLLLALKAMMGASEYKSIEVHPGEPLPPMWTRICMPSEKALDLARAAIAKAETP